jgi:NarL family two-component system response regulator LiaR
MKENIDDKPGNNPIRVLVVDDHAIIRKGIRAVLELVPDMILAGEAENGLEAVRQDEALHPDVILMDLVMPDLDGIEAIRRIKLARNDARILVLTTFAGEELVFPAIKAGALGYHLKDSTPEMLVEAIREVNRGEASLHPIVARKVLHELSSPPEQPLTTDPLTARELEILQYLARGYENPEIAARLVISEATVRTHVSNILGKLHLASRTQAALYALKEGLASLDETIETQ